MRAVLLGAAGVLAALLVVTGCGGSDPAGQATSDIEAVTAARLETTNAPTVSAQRTTASTRSEEQAASPSFQSPSGNIFCVGSGTPQPSVRCDIVEKTYPTPSEAECEDSDGGGNGGRTLSLTASGPGRFGCPTDSAISPGSPVMPYGSTRDFGGIECDMTEAGIRCESEGGHGFFLSRDEAYGY